MSLTGSNVRFGVTYVTQNRIAVCGRGSARCRKRDGHLPKPLFNFLYVEIFGCIFAFRHACARAGKRDRIRGVARGRL